LAPDLAAHGNENSADVALLCRVGHRGEAYGCLQVCGGSDLLILDATQPQAGPVARVAMPQRVPFGFHGNWFADQ
jgi:carotenoid cleavage dioxygenase-like enzyme